MTTPLVRSSSAVLAVACCAVLSLGCASTRTEGAGAAPGTSRAPDFALQSLDGATVHLSDYLGKDVVLVDFWATWCTPCLGELPHLEALAQHYKGQGLTVLGINMDGPETLANVEPTVRRYKLSFPVLLDQETRVVAQYNPARDAPYAVLIDRSGKIVEKRAGYTPGDEKSLEEKVKALLGEKPAAP